MKLSYRGVSYEHNPAGSIEAESPKLPADLKYRGASYRRGQVASLERLGAIFKYRGVTYEPQSISQTSEPTTSATPVPQVSLSIEDRTRLLNLNHNRELRNRHHAVLARLAAEIGVSENLSDYWDASSSEGDPSQWASYGRSHAALS